MPRAAYSEQLRLIDVGKHLVAKLSPDILVQGGRRAARKTVRLKGWWQDGAAARFPGPPLAAHPYPGKIHNQFATAPPGSCGQDRPESGARAKTASRFPFCAR
jgi:hypothetical protein